MSSSKTKQTTLTMLTIFGLIFTLVQGMIPAMPITDPDMILYLSSGSLFLVNLFTVWKQYYSDNIANKAIKRTLIVALIATVTGLADLFNVLHFEELTAQWIRFGFTFITALLNLLSSQLYPTDESDAPGVSGLRKISPLFILIFLLAGCKILAPKHDDHQWQAKYNASIETARMFSDMQSSSRTYTASEIKWISIGSQIDYFTAVDSIRNRATDLFKQDKVLRDIYREWRAYHEQRKSFTPKEVISTALIFKGAYDPMLISESTK